MREKVMITLNERIKKEAKEFAKKKNKPLSRIIEEALEKVLKDLK